MNEEAQPKKKGLGPLAWIAIGCLGLILVAAVVVGVGGFFAVKKGKELVEEMQDNPARSLAEMAIKMNPELEFIESDEETVTFRNQDGEVMTLNFDEIQEGRFSVESESGETSTISFGEDGGGGSGEGEANFNLFSGETDVSSLPEEIRFPGAEDWGSTFTSSGAGESTGMVNYVTDASKEEIIEWHTENLGDDCTVNEVNIVGSQHASFDCGRNSATLTFLEEGGRLKVVTNYNVKN